jgi:hypothetical protein
MFLEAANKTQSQRTRNWFCMRTIEFIASRKSKNEDSEE